MDEEFVIALRPCGCVFGFFPAKYADIAQAFVHAWKDMGLLTLPTTRIEGYPMVCVECWPLGRQFHQLSLFKTF